MLLVDGPYASPGPSQPLAAQRFNILSIDANLTRAWSQSAVEQSKERCLAGPAGSDHGDSLGRVNLKANTVQGDLPAAEDFSNAL